MKNKLLLMLLIISSLFFSACTEDSYSSNQTDAVRTNSFVEEIVPTKKVLPTRTPSRTPTARPTSKPVRVYPTSVPTRKPVRVYPTSVPKEPVSLYSCNCSKTCPNMSSCAEAYYQLNNCGCSVRDGDNDGIPCESICR